MSKRKRKIARKLSKEQKKLLIALLIGDGTISNNYVFKLSHSTHQKEYLQWKIDRLNELGIKNNGIKEYISKTGYNIGKSVLYSQMSINPTIKALRRTLYTPKKKFPKELLNWLDAKGIAIWFMDDGHINVNTSSQRSSIQHTIKISTCVDLDTANMMIEYFRETWGVNFRLMKEKKFYSISTSYEADCAAFVKIVKPYILPSLLYKIRKDFTKEQFIQKQNDGFEVRDIIF